MSKNNKIKLSFTDDIGYTEFTVNKKWYEQYYMMDSEKLFHLACEDDNSGLSDCTGKYYE